jgi:NAD(P)-dependent dehydrogenase (short-subunit alcohol dehydrogenase family)
LKLEGKVAVVTGGAQGIGRGIVRCLAEEGADIAVVDVDGDHARNAVDEVKEMGRRAFPVVADLTASDDVEEAVAAVIDYFGRIDILVNNVGGAKGVPESRTEPGRITNRTDEEWLGSYEINLKPTITMCRTVVPYLTAQQSGKIVNISSISGRLGDFGNMPYSVFKAGVISFTWSLSRELAPSNINVNCVCPGWVYTPLWERGATAMVNRIKQAKQSGEELPERFAGAEIEGLTPEEFWRTRLVEPNAPLGREQTAEDMGRAVAFFASDDARNITGQTLHVDGGFIVR